ARPAGWLRLAPLQLGFGSWLLLRRLTLRLHPRLAARRGCLAPRLNARWRRLGAPSLFRHHAALRLRRPSGLLGPLRSLGPVGTITPHRAIDIFAILGPLRTVAPGRPIGLIGAAGVVTMSGPVGPIPMIAPVGRTAGPGVV